MLSRIKKLFKNKKGHDENRKNALQNVIYDCLNENGDMDELEALFGGKLSDCNLELDREKMEAMDTSTLIEYCKLLDHKYAVLDQFYVEYWRHIDEDFETGEDIPLIDMEIFLRHLDDVGITMGDVARRIDKNAKDEDWSSHSKEELVCMLENTQKSMAYSAFDACVANIVGIAKKRGHRIIGPDNVVCFDSSWT